jgi:hypothetical protein
MANLLQFSASVRRTGAALLICLLIASGLSNPAFAQPAEAQPALACLPGCQLALEQAVPAWCAVWTEAELLCERHGDAIQCSSHSSQRSLELLKDTTVIWRVSGATGDSAALARKRDFTSLALPGFLDASTRCADTPDGVTCTVEIIPTVKERRCVKIRRDAIADLKFCQPGCLLSPSFAPVTSRCERWTSSCNSCRKLTSGGRGCTALGCPASATPDICHSFH